MAKISGEALVNGAIQKIQDLYTSIFPNIPFEYTYLEEDFDRMHQQEQRISQLFNLFAGILLFISCLGLFGLSTFTVERRTKEIDIRKVLGANIQMIVRLLTRDFLILVLISFFIAIPIIWYVMQRWLEGYAYKVEIEWWMYGTAGLLALMIAIFTVSFQSVRAAMANPVKALRNE